MEDLPIITIQDGDLTFEIRNPRYVSNDPTGFVCDLNHPELGWIPYGVCDGDAEDTFCYKIWKIKDSLDIAEYIPPEPVVPTLDEIRQQINVLRENKIVELENYRSYLRNTETASYDNDSFLIRQEDQNNMNTYYSRAIAMKMGVVPSDTFTIMSVTNTAHTFTPDQIIELSKIMYVKVEEIYQRHWYAQNVLLANAVTADEINAVQIPLSL